MGFSQSVEQNWNFQSIEKQGENIIPIDNTDTFTLKDGKFNYSLVAKDSLRAEGTYIHQNNLLIFNYTQPSDTVRYYNIAQLSDSILTITENDVSYTFSKNKVVSLSPVNNEINEDLGIKPNEGFSLTSLWKGILGMFVLVVIAFLFSSNRMAINWKKVGIGLSLQLLIAVGVLKIGFIQSIFDFVGEIFIQILEYTKAGSGFLFE